MIIWLATSVALLVTILLGKYFFLIRSLPPGPWGLPIVGYLPWIDSAAPYKTFTNLVKKYGNIYGVQMGQIYTVVLADAQLIRKAFAMEEFSGRANLYLTHGIMKGNGIICVEGEKWKEMRKFVTTTLRNLGIVKLGSNRRKMEENIMLGVHELFEILKRDDDAADIEKSLIHTMGNVVFKLVFGRTWREDDETWETLQNLQEEGTKMISVAGPLNFLPFLRHISRFGFPLQFVADGIKFTHEIYEGISEDYSLKLETEKNPESDLPDHVMGYYLMEQKKRGGYFTEEQFYFLMADLFGAGLDTTLATLRWLLLFMALNQNEQAKAREELNSTTSSDELNLDHFPNCPYFEACICEAERIRPVTPVGIPHGTLKDTTLNGYRIPQGTMIMPLLWAVHMDPKEYDDPEKFNPERFLTEEGRLKKTEAFLPFQTGKRKCVGEEYARCMLFLFGGNIIKNFEIICSEEPTNLDGEAGITLTPPAHKLILKRIIKGNQ